MTEPTPDQAMLLLGLLANHGACKKSELKPAPKDADREAMEAAKLISSVAAGRVLSLTLEDAGWAWAADHLAAPLPVAHGTLHLMLARLGEHLARTGGTLAEFIGPKPEPAVAPKPAKAPAKPRATRKPVATPRSRILEAYAEIASGRTGLDVRLSELRTKLGRAKRETIDAALVEMHLEGGRARLMRIENDRALTAADRKAALHFKGNDFHVLWIES